MYESNFQHREDLWVYIEHYLVDIKGFSRRNNHQ